MRLGKILLGSACSVLIASSAMAAGTAAVFDWEEFDANWWEGFNYSEVDNGVTMTAGGRATGSHGGDGAGGTNGVAFKSDYSQDLEAGSFIMEEGGVSTYFVVQSIDISAQGGGEYTPTVKGMAGAVTVWTILPEEGVGLAVYTEATTGSMTNAIDRIVWTTGEAAEPGLNYNNQIDNLSIVTAEEPVFESGTATFDWEEFDGNWWDAASFTYTETENGITMAHSGRTSGTSGGDGPGGANGSAFRATYSQDLEPGYISVNVGGVDSWFVVDSIDISANAGTPAAFTPMVQGEAGGVVQWTIIPQTNAGLVTYTAATEGDLSSPIERIAWHVGESSDPGNTWGNNIDNLLITTSEPAFESIYNWDFANFWTPHGVFSWNLDTDSYAMNILGFDQYWWSGGDTTGTPTVIKHRPGLADLPAGGGFGGADSDTNVGGLGNRGLYVPEAARTLVTNEVLKITYDWKMFVNGSEDARFIDMFFTTVGNTDAKRFGQTGNELGFAWHQTSVSNDVAITFDAGDDWMATTPPVLRIPLTDLGIDIGTGDHDGDDLAITYTAEKTVVADTWLCSLTISNKTTEMSYSVENVAVVNAAIYNNPSYYCVYTPDDLSNGDATSGANPAGYEIDELRVMILLIPDPEPEGYDAFLIEYGMDGEENSGAYEDFDNDGLLNIYEYGFGGDPTDPADQGTLPELEATAGVTSYYILELKDPLSGINYEIKTTTDLVNVEWSDVPAWDSVDVQSFDELYNRVERQLEAAEPGQFFKTVITTNAP